MYIRCLTHYIDFFVALFAVLFTNILFSCRAREALMLREDLMKSRQAERLAKQKLVEVTTSPDGFSVSTCTMLLGTQYVRRSLFIRRAAVTNYRCIVGGRRK